MCVRTVCPDIKTGNPGYNKLDQTQACEIQYLSEPSRKLKTSQLCSSTTRFNDAIGRQRLIAYGSVANTLTLRVLAARLPSVFNSFYFFEEKNITLIAELNYITVVWLVKFRQFSNNLIEFDLV